MHILTPLPSCIKDLTRVHQPVRVEASLQSLHDTNSLEAQLVNEGSFLAEADAVFAGAGSFHFEGAIDHVVHDLFNAFSFCWILTVVQDRGVEVAVTDMAKYAGETDQDRRVLSW